MFIRPAFRTDLQACLDLTSSYETECVWQVEQREAEPSIGVTLRPMPLPRPVQVAYPSAGWGMMGRWEQGACVFVAELDGRVRGYIDMGALRDQELGWVHNLVVDLPYRRQGLGTGLVQEATRWAQQRSLRRVMFTIQSKNHPAVQFLRGLGCVFCGFNDRYFANRDIALFYSSKVS